MRNMFRMFLGFCLILCLYVFVDFKLSVNEVSVDAHYYMTPANSAFHDDIFYKCVVDAYNNENNTTLSYDVSLTDEQLGKITVLDCNRLDFDDKISDVSGIEKLVSLENLDLSNNHLVGIDLSKNVFLKKLNLSDNQLTEIDLSKNVSLKSVSLGYNRLTKIDVSENVSLEYLSLSHNQLTEIDVSKNLLLNVLNLFNNKLTSIDLSKNVSLEILNLDDNQLTEIDVEKNVLLKELRLLRSSLTSIDLSNNTLLEVLDLDYNQLTRVDLSKNTMLKELKLFKNNLVNIDLSKNSSLESIGLDYNQLTSIDLSNNLSLKNLSLKNNKLTSIDLSNNSFLEYLVLDGNKLTDIDLSHNTFLYYVILGVDNSFFSDSIVYSYYGNESDLFNQYDFLELNHSVILPDGLPYTLANNSFKNKLSIGANSVNISYNIGENLVYIQYLINVVKATSDKYYIDDENSVIYVGNDSDDDVILSNISLGDENVSGSIIDGKYVVKYRDIVLKSFDLIGISSDKYDLSKGYLYGNIDDIISGINFDDSKLSIGLNLVLNKVEVKYGDIVVDKYDYVNYTSRKYDLSSDSINVSDNDISSFLSNISCTNCRAYVYDGNNNLSDGEFGDNYKLRIMYGNEVVKSFDLTFSVIGVSLNTHSVRMNLDSKNFYVLSANVLPVNAQNKDVIWESSNSLVAEVVDGVIWANEYGEADITVRTVEGDFTDTCHVVVSDIITHTVSFRYENNSYDVEFTDGENIVFKTDLERDGYRLVGWRYNNTDYSFNDSLVMPDHDIDLEAIWDVIIPDIDNYTISDGFMSGISLNTDISDFNLGIDSMYEVKITNNKGVLKTSGLICTGDSINIYLGDELVVSYKVVVKGDINGDGRNNAHDISRLYKHIRGRISMDECYIRAADVNGDTKANAHDISKMYKYIRGRISKL